METTLVRDDLTPEEHRVLSSGRVSVHPLMNVAPGNWAHAVHTLALRGLLSVDGAQDLHKLRMMGMERSAHYAQLAVTGGMQPTVYTVTPAGRSAYLSYGLPFVPFTNP